MNSVVQAVAPVLQPTTTNSIGSIMKTLADELSIASGPVRPHNLLNAMPSILPSAVKGAQNDAPEFYESLMASMEVAGRNDGAARFCGAYCGWNAQSVAHAQCKHPDVVPAHPSLCRLTGGVKSTCTCSGCLVPSTVTEPFYHLQLGLAGVHNLETALHNHFTQVHMIPDFECSSCTPNKHPAKQTLELDVDNLPSVLTIQLKRFDWSNLLKCRVKVTRPVTFPKKLDLQAFAPSSPTSILYTLDAIIVHEGTADDGHYIAYVRHADGWWKYDDSFVSAANWDEVASCSSAYMLFYSSSSGEDDGEGEGEGEGGGEGGGEGRAEEAVADNLPLASDIDASAGAGGPTPDVDGSNGAPDDASDDGSLDFGLTDEGGDMLIWQLADSADLAANIQGMPRTPSGGGEGRCDGSNGAATSPPGLPTRCYAWSDTSSSPPLDPARFGPSGSPLDTGEGGADGGNGGSIGEEGGGEEGGRCGEGGGGDGGGCNAGGVFGGGGDGGGGDGRDGGEGAADLMHVDIDIAQIDSQPSQLPDFNDVDLSQALLTPEPTAQSTGALQGMS